MESFKEEIQQSTKGTRGINLLFCFMVFLIHIWKLYNTIIHANITSELVWILLVIGIFCIVSGYRKRDNAEKIGWYILGISIFTSGIAAWTPINITIFTRSLCLLLDIGAASYFWTSYRKSI